jgi:hypothetical protein
MEKYRLKRFIISFILLAIGLLLLLTQFKTIALFFILPAIFGIILNIHEKKKKINHASKEWVNLVFIYITILSIITFILKNMIFNIEITLLNIILLIITLIFFYLYLRFFVLKWMIAEQTAHLRKVGFIETLFIGIFVILFLGTMVLSMSVILRIFLHKPQSILIILIDLTLLVAAIFIYFIRRYYMIKKFKSLRYKK